MKKKSSIIIKSAALLTLAATVSIVADFSNRKGIIDNAAALELMSASRIECFNQYVTSKEQQCLICIKCEYVGGVGVSVGGHCRSGAVKPGAGQ